MKEQGWIKIHRKLLNSLVYSNSTALHIWIECLLRATHQEKKIFLYRQKVYLKSGQFAMGFEEFGESINIPKTTVYYWINQLEVERMVELKRTSKGSIVTILNWKQYQVKLNSDGTQAELNKNVKNDIYKTIGKEPQKKGIYTEWQDKAFRYADRLNIKLANNHKGRWLKLFKDSQTNFNTRRNIERAVTYLVDYQPFLKIKTAEGKMKYFFWVVLNKEFA